MKKHLIVLSTVVLIACNHKSNEAVITPVELNGINGNALYFIDKNNTVITVVKPQYLNSTDYDVKIERDTVVLGTEFVGIINVYRPSFQIHITSPEEELIKGEGDNPTRLYRFSPSADGSLKFKGTIQYDSFKEPFEYDFVVVKKLEK